jgi:hypothetical protein
MSAKNEEMTWITYESKCKPRHNESRKKQVRSAASKASAAMRKATIARRYPDTVAVPQQNLTAEDFAVATRQPATAGRT